MIEKIKPGELRSMMDKYRRQMKSLSLGLRKHQESFDVINAHNFPAEIVAASSSKPVVWMCNEPELSLIGKQPGLKSCFTPSMIYLYIQYLREKYLVKNKIKNIVVSDEFNAERFHTIYGLHPTIINYGIDYDFFSGRGEGERQEDDSFVKKFDDLHVGMITGFKNQM